MTSPVRVYADEFHARHAFLAGDVEQVVGIVRRRTDPVPRVNAARWRSWVEPLTAAFDDADYPDVLAARHDIAYWTAESGDVAAALSVLGEVYDTKVRVLGVDHPDTLTTRHNIAYWSEERDEGGDDA